MSPRALIAAILVLAIVGTAAAEPTIGPFVVSGEVELGYDGEHTDNESAKYEEYRDMGAGIVGAGEMLLENEARSHYLRGFFDRIESGDQEYAVVMGQYGRYRIGFGFSQMPHNFSNIAASPYGTGNTNGSNAVMTAPFVRPPVPDLATAAGATAVGTDVGFRLRESVAEAQLLATEDLLLTAAFGMRERMGNVPTSMPFGFANFVQVSRPLDEKTYDVHGGAEFGLGGWTIDVGYDGSFFRNDLRAVIVDNPLIGVDGVGTPSRGRLATAPDNWAQSGSVSLANDLGHFDFPSRVAATFSYGQRRQDDRFLAHTINTALASPTLPQSDLDGKVHTLLANVLFTARPRPDTNVKARYRFYDHNNDTGSIPFVDTVRTDETITLGLVTANPYEYRTHTANLEVTHRLDSKTRLTAAYEWENWNRSRNREVTHLNEHTTSVKLRTKPERWMTLHANAAFGWRDRNGYETQGGTLATMRRFDMAKRLRYETDFRATLTPRSDFACSLTGSWRYDDYNRTEIGRTDSRLWSVTGDFSYQAGEYVALAGYTAYEYLDERFKSTSTAVWRSHNRDEAYNIGGMMSLVLLPDRLSAELSYDYNWGRASTHSKGNGGSPAVDFPSIKDNLQAFTINLTYDVSEILDVKWGYRFERFSGDEFQVDGIPLVAGSDVYLSDGVQDYKAHVFSGSVVVTF